MDDGHNDFVFPPLGPTGEGEPVLPPDGNSLCWQGASGLYHVMYQLDRPAVAFRCYYPGGSSPCDEATAQRFIEWAHRKERDDD